MENSNTDPRLARLIDIQRELDVRKLLYEEYDKIVLELAREGFASATVDDLVLSLKDAFAQSNTGWTAAAVKRYSVEIISVELQAKRLARASKEAK